MPEDTSKTEEQRREKILQRLRTIRDGIRITKITCTRSVKGRNGDSFVGFSATYQSVQDDHGGLGADAMTSGDEDVALGESGIGLKDAKIARYMLAMEADLAALESAASNGSISAQYFQDSVRGVKENYNKLVMRALGGSGNGRDA